MNSDPWKTEPEGSDRVSVSHPSARSAADTARLANGKTGRAVRRLALLALPALLASCHTPLLLDVKHLATLSLPDSTAHQVVLHAMEFTVEKDGRVTALTRRVVQAGTDLASFPELLTVVDSPLEKLESFDARLLHPDGSSETYGRGDLHWASLSQTRRISTAGVLYLSLGSQLRPGDLVESASRHVLGIPQLGIVFFPNEGGAKTHRATCSFDVPEGMALQFRSVNDTARPVQYAADKRTRYEFSWRNVPGSDRPLPFTKRNPGPALLVTAPGFGITDWVRFGDWYLRFVAERLAITEELRAKAAEITAGITGARAKMDAIARYCQEKVRYEQVYLERGEFLPNAVSETLKRGYGDCKDYASLMWALGHACGLTPNLALCYRGRGMEIQEDFPVSQFNHMILCYDDGDTTIWHDGTNKMPFAGVVSYDVVHAAALVLAEGSSHMRTIGEDRDNRLVIGGELQAVGTGLTGTLTLELSRQYAVELLYLSRYLRGTDFTRVSEAWIHQEISSTMVVSSVAGKETGHGFTLTVEGEIPNCLLALPPAYYLSAGRLCDRLLPALDRTSRSDDVFYLPHFGRVDVDVRLRGFADTSATPGSPAALTMRYDLPIGPYEPAERDTFVAQYQSVRREYERKRHFLRNPQ